MHRESTVSTLTFSKQGAPPHTLTQGVGDLHLNASIVFSWKWHVPKRVGSHCERVEAVNAQTLKSGFLGNTCIHTSTVLPPNLAPIYMPLSHTKLTSIHVYTCMRFRWHGSPPLRVSVMSLQLWCITSNAEIANQHRNDEGIASELNKMLVWREQNGSMCMHSQALIYMVVLTLHDMLK